MIFNGLDNLTETVMPELLFIVIPSDKVKPCNTGEGDFLLKISMRRR